ncbi:MAG: hypothetical protein ACE5K8_06895 [Candidatus Zixiibacteriota bacterium]
MSRRVIAIAATVCIIAFAVQSSWAQHFVKMSDRQRIELAVDMIRKGVQAEDTAKVFMVFAPEVVGKDKQIERKGDLTKRLQAVFNDSGQRQVRLERPSFP